MAKTLDEIDADVRTVIDHYSSALHEPPRVALESILALVAHVRELKKVLPARADLAVDRITTLEAKVAVLEAPTTLRAWADGLARSVDASAEMDRLRAELATLKALNAGQHAENARMASRHHDQLAEGGAVNMRLTEERDALRAENAELRAQLVNGAPVTLSSWPTPQPIETAPLGQLMAWDPSGEVAEGFGPAWVHEMPNPGMTVEEWRALLKTWGRTHWLPGWWEVDNDDDKEEGEGRDAA